MDTFNPKTLALMDAICESIDVYYRRDNSRHTYCNFAVQHVYYKLYGNNPFEGMLANQMIDYIRDNISWVKVNMPRTQELANQGRLVIACEKAEPHGHVVVIRPSIKVVMSHKWKCFAPQCINIGEGNFVSKGINWAFIDIPEFYMHI